jgi:hypothetical protein
MSTTKNDTKDIDTKSIIKNRSNVQSINDKIIYVEHDKKIQAELDLNIINDEELYLFSKDIIPNSSAQQFVLTTYDFIYHLSTKSNGHYYEYNRRGEPLKLHLDIDYKYPSSDYTMNDFDILIDKCITLINIHLMKYHPYDKQIIILSSCRKEKYSCHIIYYNVVFSDIYSMKYFINNINSDLINMECGIDPSIYKVGCFRLYLNSKYGRSNKLSYHRSINYQPINKRELFMDCLLKNIYHINQNNIISLKPIISKKHSRIPNKISNSNTVSNMESDKDNINYDYVKDLSLNLSPNRINTYNTWCSFIILCSNIGFPDIAHLISSKDEKYDPKKIDDILARYKNSNYNEPLTIRSLERWSYEDNPLQHEKIIQLYNRKTNKIHRDGMDFYQLQYNHEYHYQEITDKYDYIVIDRSPYHLYVSY